MVCVAPLCLETQLCTYVQTKSLAALSISFTYSLYLGHTRLPVTHPFSHPFKYTPCIETNNRWLQFPGQEACQFRREEEDKVGMEPGPSVSFPNVSKICPLLPDSSDDVASRQNVFLNRLLNHPLLQISIQIVRSSCPLGQREEKRKKKPCRMILLFCVLGIMVMLHVSFSIWPNQSPSRDSHFSSHDIPLSILVTTGPTSTRIGMETGQIM